MSVLLPIAFLGVAFLYSMAGFGGGSSYIALLAISGLPFASIPVLALSCNLIVSGQGSILLARSGQMNRRLLIPLLAGSIPAAFVGGAWRLDSQVYLWLLTIVLTIAGLALLMPTPNLEGEPVKGSNFQLFLIGSSLGALAGLSGIGGGIFLAPALHFLRAERARAIAATAALFIAVNSAAGLLGQLSKDFNRLADLPLSLYLGCPIAVLVGGFMGTRTLTLTLPPRRIRTITAIVVLVATSRLWIKLLVDV